MMMREKRERGAGKGQPAKGEEQKTEDIQSVRVRESKREREGVRQREPEWKEGQLTLHQYTIGLTLTVFELY